MRFVFKAVNLLNNEIVTSHVEAPGREEAIAMLGKKNLRVVNITEESSSMGNSAILAFIKKVFKGGQSTAINIDTQSLLAFFEKLHRMVSAGLTVSDSISTINKRTKVVNELALTSSLLSDILSGVALSYALKKAIPNIDNNVYSIVLVGESSGNLGLALVDAVALLRRGVEFKKKLISSLTYPAFMMSMVVVVIFAFAFYLMPMIEDFVKDLGGDLPPLAKILSKFAKALTYVLPVVAVVGIIVVILIPIIRKSAIGRYKTDEIILNLQPFSSMVRLSIKTNLTNVMATLLSNGVNTSNALEIAKLSIANKVALKKFLSAKTDILNGDSVCMAFEKYGVLDGEACDFLAVGEKTGDLASSFKYIYGMYVDDLNATMKKVVASTTAVALTIVFSLVGLFAFSVVQVMVSATAAASSMGGGLD
ncbi:MAG: type II secretion system F family protein [Puniceicoccales bacterium]|jgi:type IV pilus assembly protein PilC|nr:type II secretion system F family protein [Puniceicoccales bacterium]